MNKALMSIFTSSWLFSASGFAQLRELPAPAGRGSGLPNLASPHFSLFGGLREKLRFRIRFGNRIEGSISYEVGNWVYIFRLESSECYHSKRLEALADIAVSENRLVGWTLGIQRSRLEFALECGARLARRNIQ